MNRGFSLCCCLLVGLVQGACREVVEVLTAAGGASGEPSASAGAAQAGMSDGGSGGVAGQGADNGGGSAVGGARPVDPLLGIFVDAGDAHGCAARYGALYCWGRGADGRLGLGDTEDRDAPTRVGGDADWRTVATGVAHTCALKSDGGVWCFGSNSVGQLGQGTTDSSAVPLRVPLPDQAEQLSSGANTACAVLGSGELYCWGRNWEGNIGLNDTHPGVDQLSPVRSGDARDWKLTGTGDGHTCGVRGVGLLFGWGRNTAANLGLGQADDLQRRSATRIGEDDDWLSVVSGQDSSCGLRVGGQLFCWGGNSFGNLGLGDTDQRLVPTQVAPSRVWTRIAIDTFHGCGIDADGQLYCWGRGIEGQLGTSDNDERLAPELIGEGFAQVAVGRMFSCAVTQDDAISCTGENVAGQLGLPGNMRRNTFTELSFP
jgi:alpha-tubulin suppressor-like RCC1 family protein